MHCWKPDALLFGVESSALQQCPRLADDLCKYMLEEEIFNADQERLADLGFQQYLRDGPQGGDLHFEDYFHGLPTPDAVASAFPRPGSDGARPAAPARVRAFCEAVRRANAGPLSALAAAAPAGSLLRRLLLRGLAFADVCIQVRAGGAVRGPGLAWHVDRPPSMLHLALGLRGRRTLHARLRPAAAAPRAAPERARFRTVAERFAAARAQINELRAEASLAETPLLLSLPQQPGDAYVCNATSYVHAVEYPACAWEDRAIVLQLRLLVGSEEPFEPCMEWGTEQVAAALAALELRLPTLEEVRAEVCRCE